MADVRDWGAFIRGRWDWHRFGYDRGFPRGCQFTDIDAATEFDGRSLLIEAKAYDGVGELKPLPIGQLILLRKEAALGKAVFVLYGCGACNDPYAVCRIGIDRERDQWFRFSDEAGVWLDRQERRRRLKCLIDRAMGLHEGAA